MKKSILQEDNELSQLGTITIRYNKSLDCKNMDKPFVYEKQMKQIMMITKNVYQSIYYRNKRGS